jgi:hypothetical protein
MTLFYIRIPEGRLGRRNGYGSLQAACRDAFELAIAALGHGRDPNEITIQQDGQVVTRIEYDGEVVRTRVA